MLVYLPPPTCAKSRLVGIYQGSAHPAPASTKNACSDEVGGTAILFRDNLRAPSMSCGVRRLQ